MRRGHISSIRISITPQDSWLTLGRIFLSISWPSFRPALCGVALGLYIKHTGHRVPSRKRRYHSEGRESIFSSQELCSMLKAEGSEKVIQICFPFIIHLVVFVCPDGWVFGSMGFPWVGDFLSSQQMMELTIPQCFRSISSYSWRLKDLCETGPRRATGRRGKKWWKVCKKVWN